jgi:hypothetical protein
MFLISEVVFQGEYGKVLALHSLPLHRQVLQKHVALQIGANIFTTYEVLLGMLTGLFFIPTLVWGIFLVDRSTCGYNFFLTSITAMHLILWLGLFYLSGLIRYDDLILERGRKFAVQILLVKHVLIISHPLIIGAVLQMKRKLGHAFKSKGSGAI